jgi:hypothetical protein
VFGMFLPNRLDETSAPPEVDAAAQESICEIIP